MPWLLICLVKCVYITTFEDLKKNVADSLEFVNLFGNLTRVYLCFFVIFSVYNLDFSLKHKHTAQHLITFVLYKFYIFSYQYKMNCLNFYHLIHYFQFFLYLKPILTAFRSRKKDSFFFSFSSSFMRYT